MGHVTGSTRHSLVKSPGYRVSNDAPALQVSMLPLSRSRLVKRTVYTTFGLGAAYLADTELNASAVTRNLRTLWTVSLIIIGAFKL